jgi:mono/diheme cytochrome c family protein
MKTGRNLRFKSLLEISVKLMISLFAGPLGALMLGAGLPLQRATPPPDPNNPNLVITSMVGRDLFEFYCSSCHGRDGKGAGHAAAALKVPPPDLTALAQRNRGTFPVDRVEASIKGEGRLRTPAHGSSDMPVWGPIFKGLDSRDAVNAARIENLVKYIESIQAKAKA